MLGNTDEGSKEHNELWVSHKGLESLTEVVRGRTTKTFKAPPKSPDSTGLSLSLAIRFNAGSSIGSHLLVNCTKI